MVHSTGQCPLGECSLLIRRKAEAQFQSVIALFTVKTWTVHVKPSLCLFVCVCVCMLVGSLLSMKKSEKERGSR